MTRRGPAVLGLALLLVALWGCGKYGPPERAGAAAKSGAASTHDAAACSDPAHVHDAATPAP